MMEGSNGEKPPACLSFNRLVERYARTRTYNPACFAAALDHLVARFPPARFGNLFEPGIGTGRIAFPLAQRGYRVTGVDVSVEMLAYLREQETRTRVGQMVSAAQADVVKLPFAQAAFDVAIAVHLFYFIRHWRRAALELLRVVRPGNPVVLMHTGTGSEIPSLNRRYRALCAEQGYSTEFLGVTSTREVMTFYKEQGCQIESIRDRWRWTERIRLDEALAHLRARAYSFTTQAPAKVHTAALEQMSDELMREHGTLDTEVEVDNQIYLVIVSPPTCLPPPRWKSLRGDNRE